MGFSLEVNISAAAVFLQGILSFFSPCVLPLLPLYIGYLSGGTARRGEDGRISYDRKRVLLHTVFFVIGISGAFFVMGLGISALGSLLDSFRTVLVRVGGVLIFAFGLYQLGVFGSPGFLGKERRLPLHLDTMAMSPLTAFLMGFTFSFAWTPCVGPALTSVLIMAAAAETRVLGFVLIGVYTAGFVLPFLAVGFFASSLLSFFRTHGNVVKYTVKIGGILLLIIGVLMFSGQMDRMSAGLAGNTSESGASGGTGESEPPQTEGAPGGEESQETQTEGASEAAEESETEKAQETQEAEKETDESQSGAAEDGEEEPENGAAEDGEEEPESDAAKDSQESSGEQTETERVLPDAPDFTLYDQFGQEHTLSDYKGKTVFLNFWATWCQPCRMEMPYIQELYERYSSQEDPEVVILGVAGPLMGDEGSEEEIAAFLEENGYTYPVLMDTDYGQFNTYGIYSFPTTFMINAEGKVYGYITGSLSLEMMESIIQQTIEGSEVTA
ncbi:MAG TPA: redoxin domain-containing protein [Candidatus Limivivens intestinipullorum]|uniref:Redoxin domain-containing protein n=1 Tax=Candidatus Limivivens intestinipullorum TaxID=2840858 RepID=A0A9D1JJ95_9FIRM|nr:redoxin domain-containing protein [Candidatus Limivivens intestinipullorum]